MRTRRYILVLAILCFTLVLSVPAVASATVLPPTGSNANTDCLDCHEPDSTVTSTTVEFGVGAVNKATACRKCHWISPHPVHAPTQQCNALCHGRWDWGTRTDFWVSQTTLDTSATGSYFNSDDSVDTSADELHRIHTRRSWIAELAEYKPRCAGCHAAATCDACHGSGTEHGAHGVEGNPEVGEPTEVVLTNMTGGAPTSAISSDADFTFYGESGCIASRCHAGVASGYFIDDSEIDYTGDWNTVYNANLIGDSYRYSTQTTAVFEFTFTGTGFAWVGQSINTGGISDIYIDGTYRKSVDSYLGRWGLDKHVASVLGLPYEEHTVTVKNTVRSSSLWNYIFVQGIRVYGEKPDFVAAPTCAGCHDQHGDLTDRHTSTWSMDGCTAANCHLTNELAAEHDKWRPTDTCALCHGAAVSTTVAGAVEDGITACDKCHTTVAGGATHRSLHEAEPPLVDASGVPQYGYYTGTSATIKVSDCAGCHTSNLVDEHMGGSGRLPRYDSTGNALTCASCHESGDLAVLSAIAGKRSNCDECHTVHGPLWAVHASDYTSDPADTCGDCHSSNLEAVHDGGMVVTMPSGTELTGCAVCHGYTEGELGVRIQLAIDSTDGSGSLCTACHTDYHSGLAEKHSAKSTASQGCAACHDDDPATAAIDVATVHADSDLGCRVCHSNPDRVPDISLLTAECASCHEVHGDIAELHTASSPSGCFTCHGGADVRDIHGTTQDASCSVCHNDTLDLTGITTDCDSCHTNETVDFHTATASKHQGFSGTSGCDVPECHGSIYVPQIHERFVGPGKQYSQYSDSCALCHLNENPDRIDWDIATGGTCANCHDYPQHMGANHLATSEASAECVACHESNWVPGVHDPTGQLQECNLCHDNPAKGDLTWDKTDSDCEQCHEYSPAEQNHYKASVHAASEAAGCATCHSIDLAAEHAKTSSGPVSCVGCHTSDLFAAASLPWDGTCATCHPTKHAALPGKHTATVSAECARCHDKDAADGMNVEPVHAQASQGACDVCHANPARVLDITARTAECATCHAVVGAEYHRAMSSAHIFSAMDASCVAAGCHTASTLPEEHARFAGVGSRYAQYSDSCALCHLNSDVSRIDWSTAAADCSTCHTVHGDITALHTAPSSTECVACHKTADVRNLHGASPAASCVVCHNASIVTTGKTTKCVNCHAYSPASSKHPIPSGVHRANESSCRCHSMDLLAEHNSRRASVSCAECHTYSRFPVSGWNDKCSACHPDGHSRGGRRR